MPSLGRGGGTIWKINRNRYQNNIASTKYLSQAALSETPHLKDIRYCWLWSLGSWEPGGSIREVPGLWEPQRIQKFMRYVRRHRKIHQAHSKTYQAHRTTHQAHRTTHLAHRTTHQAPRNTYQASLRTHQTHRTKYVPTRHTAQATWHTANAH